MTGVTRRSLLAGLSALGLVQSGPPAFAKTSGKRDFVRTDGIKLRRGKRPYRVVGANMWYAAWLGSTAAYGDRARLRRELTRLKAMGVNNLRIMAAAEEGPLKNSVRPGFSMADGSVREELLDGLDYTLAAIADAGMTAVLCLGNFWEWSGGFSTWLHRETGSFIDMGDPAHPWPAFADASARFYGNAAAVAAYHRYVAMLLARRNSITGIAYRDDPTIMSWQLANEPRPGGSAAFIQQNLGAYLAWIESSVRLIRAGAPNHLVSLGQEGSIASNGNIEITEKAHRTVDYLTAHIWPLNWGWVDGKNLAGTWPEGKKRVEQYLEDHVALANRIGKPLLVEEFGFPRDGESYDPKSASTFRELYYRLIQSRADKSLRENGPIAGTNFWAWNGEARSSHGDFRMQQGDTNYMGDPPHEPQGWYGVFDTDRDMQKLIRAHSRRFAAG